MALHGPCRFAALCPPRHVGGGNVTAFLVDSYTDSCIGYGTMQRTNEIPPLRPGWADAKRWPVTVSLLKYWENPHSTTLNHIAALQLYRCERAGLPSILEVSVG